MAQNAYCNECGTRVTLAEDGTCENGHPRSALRDVREGGIVEAPRSGTPQAGSAPGGAGASAPRAGAPTQAPVASRVIGAVLIAVPAAFVVALALWSGYAAGIALGQTRSGAWLSSIGSLVLTGALVALWVAKRRTRK